MTILTNQEKQLSPSRGELLELARQREEQGRGEEACDLFAAANELFHDRRDLDIAIQELRCAINLCRWDRYEYLQRIVVNAVRYLGGYVLGETTVASPWLGIHDLSTCTGRWAAAAYRRNSVDRMSLNPMGVGFARSAPTQGRPLAVGFLGCDFYSQATAYLMAGLIDEHDRERFRYVAYDYGVEREDDAYQKRMRLAFDVFHRVDKQSNQQIAAQIIEDGIDVLLFLKGPYDARAEVLAIRPAAVQLAYLYYPAGFGFPAVDAVIADDIVIPPTLEHFYTERVIRLPRCYQPNDAHRPVAQPISRKQVGLPEGAFVLANFGQSYKITPYIFDVWCHLLRTHGSCLLWLLDTHPDVVRNLKIEASVRGVDPARLVFAPSESVETHLSRIACADLILDTFPYGGHTGTSDALWAGVPVVTRIGETFASRVAASLLHAVGLDELVTTSDDAYRECAAALIAQPQKLRALRDQLILDRKKFSLFDTVSYARDFEAMLLRVVEDRTLGARLGGGA